MDRQIDDTCALLRFLNFRLEMAIAARSKFVPELVEEIAQVEALIQTGRDAASAT